MIDRERLRKISQIEKNRLKNIQMPLSKKGEMLREIHIKHKTENEGDGDKETERTRDRHPERQPLSQPDQPTEQTSKQHPQTK